MGSTIGERINYETGRAQESYACQEEIMTINIWTVIVATVAQFVVGAIWYMPLFGKIWGKIHGFDRQAKSKQAQMQRAMMPLLAVQLLMAAITAFTLAWFASALENESTYMLAIVVWLGFVMPAQVSAVIFGGTPSEWVVKKIAIMVGGSLVCYLVAAAILSGY